VSHLVTPAALATISEAQPLPDYASMPEPLPTATVALATAATAVPAANGPVTRAVPTPARARALAALVRFGPQIQYQIIRLGPAGQVGLAALFAAAVIAASVLLPARNALEALSVDIAQAQRPHAAGTSEQPVPRFVASLPTREQIPAVIGEVFQQAQKAGVPLDTGHYAFSAAKAGSLGRYDLEFPVKAGYPNVRDFIDRTLTAIPAAGLGGLHIERKAVADTVVNADIRFVIFVRSE
jgi:hypothetical protein